MSVPIVGQKIIHLESVESTNPYLLNEFKNGRVSSGTVLHADIQTKGRGQRMKEWHSEPFANLMLSIAADLNLWKIQNIISLNHIVAVSIQEFLKGYVNDVKVKWPNDIMVNDKKMVGILIENQLSSSQRRSVIGIGVNINQQEFNAPRATSLSLETGKFFKIQELIFELIAVLNKNLNDFQQKGEAYYFQLFNENLWKLNETHPFIIDDKTIEGQIVSSDLEGQLQVSLNGEIVDISNGQVKY